MSLSILTNTAATHARDNLSSVSTRLQNSLNRLSSGNKIVSPADDAGGLAVSMKMDAAIKRQAAASGNISNAMSFLQTQDGALSLADKVLARMGELKVLSQDVTKNASDIENYETEFQALRSQLNSIAEEKFNGISLFSSESKTVSASGDGGTKVQLQGVDLLGTNAAPFSAVTSDFSNLDGFSNQSQNTAYANVSGNRLTLGTDDNHLARIETDLSVTGGWELSFDFSKTSVANDDMSVTLGGSEVFSYDATNSSNHSVRIVFDGVNTAEIYLDGASTPSETNAVGASSGNIGLQLTSTVSGAEAYIDNFSLASTTTSNDVGSIAASASLSSLDVGTLKDATQEIASFRAQGGAQQSRLQFAKDQLDVNMANLEAANSRILDVDVASESTRLAKLNILQQASAAMLSQANQSQQVALKLIG